MFHGPPPESTVTPFDPEVPLCSDRTEPSLKQEVVSAPSHVTCWGSTLQRFDRRAQQGLSLHTTVTIILIIILLLVIITQAEQQLKGGTRPKQVDLVQTRPEQVDPETRAKIQDLPERFPSPGDSPERRFLQKHTKTPRVSLNLFWLQFCRNDSNGWVRVRVGQYWQKK